jgi:hypothetical protein
MGGSLSSFFCCRICGHLQYSPVRIRQPSGAWDVTPYWKCMGCSAMFTDPKAFSRQRTAEEVAAAAAAGNAPGKS